MVLNRMIECAVIHETATSRWSHIVIRWFKFGFASSAASSCIANTDLANNVSNVKYVSDLQSVPPSAFDAQAPQMFSEVDVLFPSISAFARFGMLCDRISSSSLRKMPEWPGPSSWNSAWERELRLVWF